MIYLGADHAGLALKTAVIAYLEKKKLPYEDVGAHGCNEQDDYPDFIIPAAEKTAKGKGALGIVFGGSGQGEALAANKVKGVRAALYYGGNKDIITLSREHNNANVLALGGRFLSEKEAVAAVDLWLKTPFSGDGRHVRRLKKIAAYETR